MTLYSCFQTAIIAIRLNAMRSILTTLGIIIGVASVIVMASIGSGARKQIEDRISALGTNMLTLSPGSRRVRGRRGGAGTAKPFTEADMKAIQTNVEGIAFATGELRGSAPVIYGNQNWSTSVSGVHAEFPEVQDWAIGEGRFFTEREARSGVKLVILGTSVAKKLFGSASPVGEQVRVAGVPFKIIGVMETRGQTGGWRDRDDIIFVPISTARSRLVSEKTTVPNQVGSILVKVENNEQLAEVEEEIGKLLRARRNVTNGKEDDFSVRNIAEIVKTRRATQQTLTWLLAVTAAISLVVGGIGIMNIMLVSVTERTREIGLRIAVGARGRDIMAQFLTESIVLCLVGGTIGLAIGVSATFIVAKVAAWPVLISPEMILIAIGASAGVGVVFGYFPARKAARLNPIDALRYE
ncbi:MAG: ABC transporter permease [Methyloligellaceae bacterium]